MDPVTRTTSNPSDLSSAIVRAAAGKMFLRRYASYTVAAIAAFASGSEGANRGNREQTVLNAERLNASTMRYKTHLSR